MSAAESSGEVRGGTKNHAVLGITLIPDLLRDRGRGRSALRGTRHLASRGNHPLPDRAEVLRSGSQALLRLQSRRGDPRVSGGGEARSILCHGPLGNRLCARAERKPAGRSRPGEGSVRGGAESARARSEGDGARARVHRGAGQTLFGRSQSRSPRSGRRLRGRDARPLGEIPGRPGRLRDPRRGASRRDALGLVDARREAAAGNRRGRRGPNPGSPEEPVPRRSKPPLHPRARGIPESGARASRGEPARGPGAQCRPPRAHALPHLHASRPLSPVGGAEPQGDRDRPGLYREGEAAGRVPAHVLESQHAHGLGGDELRG